MQKYLLKRSWIGGCILAVLAIILLLQLRTQALPSDSLNSSFMMSSVQPISSAVTEAEIALREKQLEIARGLQKSIAMKQRAGVAGYEEPLQAQYFIIENEIQLLQARQLLQVKRQCDKNTA
ncbi:MAG: hypothetical protein NW224_04965 [Leptolyngbyaceae cyanobacterium bins.302]|nr:hypothetical protein [Leptolyngbyaceae cyanobacterium bins.302]